MEMRFFTIPVLDADAAAQTLNRFLATHRILTVDRSFVQDGANSAWALCVSYETAQGRTPAVKRGKIDYRDVFNEQDFAVFSRLRALRKELAEREGIPAYALFTNEQLAEMVRQRVRTAVGLSSIAGVGNARVNKYGDPFLGLLLEAFPHSENDPPEPADEAQSR